MRRQICTCHDLELSVLKPIDAPTVLRVDLNVECCVTPSSMTVNKLERMGTIIEMHHGPASATRGRYTAVTKLFIVQFCCCPSWRLSTARPNVQHGAGATNGIFNPIR